MTSLADPETGAANASKADRCIGAGPRFTQHQKQFRRAEPPELTRRKAEPRDARPHHRGPVETGMPVHSGTLNARDNSCAATRAASITPAVDLRPVTRSFSSPDQAAATQPRHHQRKHVARPHRIALEAAPPTRSGSVRPAGPRARPAHRASVSPHAARQSRRSTTSPAHGFAHHAPQDRGEGQGTGGRQRHLIGRLAVVIARVVDSGDLKRTLDDPEIGG